MVQTTAPSHEVLPEKWIGYVNGFVDALRPFKNAWIPQCHATLHFGDGSSVETLIMNCCVVWAQGKDLTQLKKITIFRVHQIGDDGGILYKSKEPRRIPRTHYQACLMLTDESLIKKIASFPEHSMGCSLVDVTLFDGTVVEQVPITYCVQVCFYDNMRAFSEADIKDVAPSQV